MLTLGVGIVAFVFGIATLKGLLWLEHQGHQKQKNWKPPYRRRGYFD